MALVESGTEPQMYTLLSFDLYGTLINTPPANAKAFGAIVRDAKAHHVEVDAFYKFWEKRNISHYFEPYRSYKQICRTSLQGRSNTSAFARVILISSNIISLFSEK
jgi:FMN phosphatase YigB (HAD superfamily)